MRLNTILSNPGYQLSGASSVRSTHRGMPAAVCPQGKRERVVGAISDAINGATSQAPVALDPDFQTTRSVRFPREAKVLT